MPLNDQDKIHYLANVLKVAFDDKSLSVREIAALEEIRKSIDAKKGLLTSAQKAVESGSFNFIKAGSFADQVKNLEAMIFVALTDTDLSESESRLVNEFINLIGISQSHQSKSTKSTYHRNITLLRFG